MYITLIPKIYDKYLYYYIEYHVSSSNSDTSFFIILFIKKNIRDNIIHFLFYKKMHFKKSIIS